MTPKEQALELMDMFGNIFLEDEEEHYVGTVSRLSKKCALKAVDKIISLHNRMPDDISRHYVKYYEEVKQEIEKL